MSTGPAEHHGACSFFSARRSVGVKKVRRRRFTCDPNARMLVPASMHDPRVDSSKDRASLRRKSDAFVSATPGAGASRSKYRHILPHRNTETPRMTEWKFQTISRVTVWYSYEPFMYIRFTESYLYP